VKLLKVGIVGSGGIAQAVHIPGYQELPDVKVVALCDLNRATLKAAAEKFGVEQTFTDYRQMLRKVDPDIVSVCTPNADHAAPTIAALKAGAHVLVEKPIAMNAAEGRQMVAAAKKAKRLLMVGFQNRYDPAAQFMRRSAGAGDFGEIYYGEAHYLRRRGIPGWGAFIEKKRSGGGALMDIGVHALDLALYIMGHPKPVSVAGAAFMKLGHRKDVVHGMGAFDVKRFDVDDFGVGLIRFANGGLLLLKASWAANLEGGWNVSMIGTQGGFSLNPLKVYAERHGSLVDITPVDLPRVRTHFEEIRLFVEAIRKGRAAPIPGENGLMATAILDAIYKSGEKGKEVRVEI